MPAFAPRNRAVWPGLSLGVSVPLCGSGASAQGRVAGSGRCAHDFVTRRQSDFAPALPASRPLAAPVTPWTPPAPRFAGRRRPCVASGRAGRGHGGHRRAARRRFTQPRGSFGRRTPRPRVRGAAPPPIPHDHVADPPLNPAGDGGRRGQRARHGGNERALSGRLPGRVCQGPERRRRAAPPRDPQELGQRQAADRGRQEHLDVSGESPSRARPSKHRPPQ